MCKSFEVRISLVFWLVGRSGASGRGGSSELLVFRRCEECGYCGGRVLRCWVGILRDLIFFCKIFLVAV